MPSASDPTTAASDPILDAMVQRLVGALAPARIYLFGSRARGEARPDSDYDLLVVLSDSGLPRYRREQAAFRALCGVGAPKDVLVFTHREFERARAVASSLPSTVLREGKLVYVA